MRSPCAGRIFEFVHGHPQAPPLLGPNNLPQVVEALLAALRDAPFIAVKVGASAAAVAWPWWALQAWRAVKHTSVAFAGTAGT